VKQQRKKNRFKKGQVVEKKDFLKVWEKWKNEKAQRKKGKLRKEEKRKKAERKKGKQKG
jgi:hypothetical protein